MPSPRAYAVPTRNLLRKLSFVTFAVSVLTRHWVRAASNPGSFDDPFGVGTNFSLYLILVESRQFSFAYDPLAIYEHMLHISSSACVDQNAMRMEGRLLVKPSGRDHDKSAFLPISRLPTSS